MRFTPPKFIKRIFPDLIWNLADRVEGKKIFLTFDDGPTPEITDWVLNCLKEEGIKATFFCLGKNVEQHPDIFQRIIEAGHAAGNHSYSHQKGWSMPTGRYVEDIDLADSFIKSNLVRPPYGRIRPRQAYRLAERYKLIMWDLISLDYSRYCSPTRCFDNVMKNSRHGSIVVFHDSQKAFTNLSYTLPRAIRALKEEGYSFDKIEL